MNKEIQTYKMVSIFKEVQFLREKKKRSGHLAHRVKTGTSVLNNIVDSINSGAQKKELCNSES